MSREQRNFQLVVGRLYFEAFCFVRFDANVRVFKLKFLRKSVFMVLAEIRLFIGVDKSYNALAIDGTKLTESRT